MIVGTTKQCRTHGRESERGNRGGKRGRRREIEGRRGEKRGRRRGKREETVGRRGDREGKYREGDSGTHKNEMKGWEWSHVSSFALFFESPFFFEVLLVNDF